MSEEIPRELTSYTNDEQKQTNIEQSLVQDQSISFCLGIELTELRPIPAELGIAPPVDLLTSFCDGFVLME